MFKGRWVKLGHVQITAQSTRDIREAFKKKKRQIWEFFPIGWVGLHPVPNFWKFF